MNKPMLKRLIEKLDQYRPVFCALCLRLIFDKDATYRQTTGGHTVPLCKACDDHLYHPYKERT